MTLKQDNPLQKRITRILTTPNIYKDFPAAVIYDYQSKRGHRRATCPVEGCQYDGLPSGFNQHYARVHAPEQWGQKSSKIIKAVRSL